MKNIVLTAPGDVGNLVSTDAEAIPLEAGEVRIRHDAIGVNFIDIYQRTGIYPLPSYPAVIGVEAAGIVEAVGEEVTGFQMGDRVAYAGGPAGAYCSTRNLMAARLVHLPEDISAKTAAGSLMKGMTAQMLLRETFRLQPGETVLIHAAAGGLGSMLVRLCKLLGAAVIGTVGSAAKAELAISNGADHVIIGREADVVADVLRLTNGQGVNLAIDGIGGRMLAKSLRSVRPFGMVASIGQAAGPAPPVAIEELRPGKTLSHPSFMAWVSDLDRYHNIANATLEAMQAGLVAQISDEFTLDEAAQAHRKLESGQSHGSILLIPQS